MEFAAKCSLTCITHTWYVEFPIEGEVYITSIDIPASYWKIRFVDLTPFSNSERSLSLCHPSEEKEHDFPLIKFLVVGSPLPPSIECIFELECFVIVLRDDFLLRISLIAFQSVFLKFFIFGPYYRKSCYKNTSLLCFRLYIFIYFKLIIMFIYFY